MSHWQFLTRDFGSLALCYLLASGIAGDASAQTHSSTQDGRRITIDVSPSSEFVSQALADLQELFPPYEPAPDQPWCCYVGNYSEMIEPDDIDDEDVLRLFRLTDDIKPFGIGLGAESCDRGACVTGASFLYYGTSASELVSYIAKSLVTNGDRTLEFIDTPSGELAPLIGWHLDTDEATSRFPVYIRPNFSTPIMSDVWAVTIAAAPEPSSAALCLIAVTVFWLCRHRPQQVSLVRRG